MFAYPRRKVHFKVAGANNPANPLRGNPSHKPVSVTNRSVLYPLMVSVRQCPRRIIKKTSHIPHASNHNEKQMFSVGLMLD